MNAPVNLDRRRVLAGGGALIVSFSLSALPWRSSKPRRPPAPAPSLPGSLKNVALSRRLDPHRCRRQHHGVHRQGRTRPGLQDGVSADRGGGARSFRFESLKVVTADTAPDRRTKAIPSGSHSMKDSGTAIQNAAAQVRELLIAEAAQRGLVCRPRQLRTDRRRGDRARWPAPVAMASWSPADMLHVQAQPKSKLKDPATFKVIGQSVPRVDIPAKVTGGAAYVQDMRLPGMVHARVVRPPSYGAQLTECDTAAVEKLPGVVKVVRDGNFLAVVAEKEFQAIKAMNALAAAAKWQETAQPAEAGRPACAC